MTWEQKQVLEISTVFLLSSHLSPQKNKVMNHGIKRREGGIKDQEQGDRATHKNKRKWGTKENKKGKGGKNKKINTTASCSQGLDKKKRKGGIETSQS